MTHHDQKCAEALHTALEMEIEGKQFYSQSAEASSSQLARDLFQHLAAQEDVHYQTVHEVYEAVKSGNEWPQKETMFKHPKSLKDVFNEATEMMDVEANPAASELDAIKTGMSMEDKSYSFYKSRYEEATSPAEKQFYQALTAEERKHYLTLVASYEYLSNPQGWFTMKEHWSLDG